MRVNTGGELATEEVIGRVKLTEQLWRVLERQSLTLHAERRMGKTSLVKRMVALPQGDVVIVYRDLENVNTPSEFVERVVEDIHDYLTRLKRTTNWLHSAWKGIGGIEIGGVLKIPSSAATGWKLFLERTIDSLLENQPKNSRFIFAWDEMPLMLDNIRQNSEERAAMEVLDTLRALRQTHSDLRMIFTGSIGLHHVVTALRDKGYANDPTNDMSLEELPPLETTDAEALAGALLMGEGIRTADRDAVARCIAKHADNVPFFIHQFIGQLARLNTDVSIKDVDKVVTRLVDEDAQDRLHLGYYRERIKKYYGEDQKPIALGLLDVLAVAPMPLSFNELFNGLKSQIEIDRSGKDAVRDVLTLLQRDHYVIRESAAYRFQYTLIARSWRAQRDL